MNFPKKALLGLVVLAVAPLVCAQATGKPAATIRRMTVLRAGTSVELEISASQPLVPETQMVTGPDRLVLDFPNTLPGGELRTLKGMGGMKSVRVGLYKSNPPVTRVVLDLKSAQPYELFPSGNTVIVKLDAGVMPNAPSPAPVAPHNAPAAVPAVASNDMPAALPPVKPASKVEVQFQNGNLSIWADRATLAEVLFEVHKRTGAEIAIPSGAEQEQVVAKIGPLPAREAMAALLNGSRFNFIMVGSSSDSSLRSVILSLREGGAPPMSNYAAPSSATAQAAPEPQPEDDAAQDAPPPQPPVEGAEEPIPARDQPEPQPPQ